MDKVTKVVRNVLEESPSNIIRIKSGTISETYSFIVNKDDYVIRFGSNRLGYDKDLFAYRNFSSTTISLPNTIEIGLYNDLYFSISKKMMGKTLDSYPDNLQFKAVEQVMDVLFSLSEVNIDKNKKFGFWKEDGCGGFVKWPDYLINIRLEVAEYSSLTSNTDVQKILVKLANYLKYVPNIQFLIHGDFGFNNLLYDGKEITGVLDWSDSKYGDFLYDVAYLIFWASQIDYGNKFRSFYQRKGINIDHFEERINCYLCHISLVLIQYFYSKGDKNGYLWVVKKLENSLI